MPAERTASSHPLYLCAPVNALVEGIYEENIPLAEIKRHGDFGLGTFDDLDGEMVMLAGDVYQITADGEAHGVADAKHTPFAVVTFFEPTFRVTFDEAMDYDTFLARLDALLPSPNLFYALRIRGRFDLVRARSVPKQHNYRPLSEAAAEQHEFRFENAEGCLAGFYTPAFMASLNVPGLHLHFLTQDRLRGGHLLECRTRGVTVEVQMLHTLELSLPMTHDYLTRDFGRDTAADLEAAEK
ncbi:acetolactate decarboxylase [Sulfurimonas diazotrophicus]|uniref:Alpha-acetolactate decarboxylase n=1 Tax=Sulfurimonas diazotrophicus TaxID=3131939 RepID=A0ABZ3H8V5_9BACT